MQKLSDSYKTQLVRDMLARHRGPHALAEHLPAVLADAQARKERVEAELTELADLGWRLDRHFNRDLKEPDTSISTIQAHLAAHRERKQRQGK